MANPVPEAVVPSQVANAAADSGGEEDDGPPEWEMRPLIIGGGKRIRDMRTGVEEACSYGEHALEDRADHPEWRGLYHADVDIPIAWWGQRHVDTVVAKPLAEQWTHERFTLQHLVTPDDFAQPWATLDENDSLVDWMQVSGDEILDGTQARCGWLQSMPSKPAGVGLKYWAICDSVKGRLLRVTMYTGKRADGKVQKNLALTSMLMLLAGYCVYHPAAVKVLITDNFYTSVVLALELARRFLIRLLGVCKKGSKFFPGALKLNKKNVGRKGTPDFVPKKKQGFFDYLVLPWTTIKPLVEDEDSKWKEEEHGKLSIVAGGYMDKKPVHLLSSCVGPDTTTWRRYGQRGGDGTKTVKDTVKPLMVVVYTALMNGVDLHDQSRASLALRKRIRRWTTQVFIFVVLSAVVQAHIEWCALTGEAVSLITFARRLCFQLMNAATPRYAGHWNAATSPGKEQGRPSKKAKTAASGKGAGAGASETKDGPKPKYYEQCDGYIVVADTKYPQRCEAGDCMRMQGGKKTVRRLRSRMTRFYCTGCKKWLCCPPQKSNSKTETINCADRWHARGCKHAPGMHTGNNTK